MIEVSEALKTAYKKDSVHKNLVIRFLDGSLPDITNGNIIAESMELDEILCDEEQIKFGLCNASTFSVQVANVNINIKDKDIAPVLIVEGEELPLGIFTIQKVEKMQGKAYKTIYAIDYTNKLNADVTEWYNNLTFPISVKNLRDGLFDHLGIIQVDTNLIIDNVMVNKIGKDNVQAIDIIGPICELCGRFGHANRYGQFEYISLIKHTLYPSEDLYPSENLYPGENTEILNLVTEDYNLLKSYPVYEDYMTCPIDGVVIIDNDGTIYETETYHNAYRVEYNYIIDGQDIDTISTIMDNLAYAIKGISYRPVSILEIKGQPYLELGDQLFFANNTDVVELSILTRHLKGIQSLTDNITAEGKEFLNYDNIGVHKQLSNLNQKSVEIEEEVSQTKSSIEKANSEIVLKVDKDNKIYAVRLGDNFDKGVEFTVDASNINLTAEDVINLLTGGELNLTGKKITIKSDNFNVDTNGNIKANKSEFTNCKVTGDLTVENILYMKQPALNIIFPFISLHFNTEDPFISFNTHDGTPFLQIHTYEGKIYYNKDFEFGPATMQPVSF